MARVRCTILETKVKNDYGQMVAGTRAECMRCDKVTESAGTGDKSIKRCLAMLRADCPMSEENFYVED
jgi:hypothetical protein